MAAPEHPPDERQPTNAAHTSREFEADLHELRKRTLSMAGLCETAMKAAFRAFWEGRPELAAPVRQIEEQLDRDEVELEALALRIIALRQPVARDLRFVAATLRLVTDLERIGDAAMNITECIVTDGDATRPLVDRELHVMDDAAQGMLRSALHAFVQQDPEAARRVLVRDDDVDRLCAAVIETMTEYAAVHPQDLRAALRVMWVAKYLERVADHATNVAEEVIFMVRGEDVRHSVP